MEMRIAIVEGVSISFEDSGAIRKNYDCDENIMMKSTYFLIVVARLKQLWWTGREDKKEEWLLTENNV